MRIDAFSLDRFSLDNFRLDKFTLDNYRIDGTSGGIDQFTKLMLHMNGVNGSTSFIDSSLTPKTVTAYGNAQISTAQYKFGGASGLFDGTGDYLSIPDSADWNFGTGDFTIDMWVRLASSTDGPIYSQCADGSNLIIFSISAAGVSLNVKLSGTTLLTASWPASFSLNQWSHVALCRYGNLISMYGDGVKLGTDVTFTGSMPDINFPVYISAYNDGAFHYFNGYIDEVRVSKGIARWTSNFTPPSYEYTT